MPLSGPFAATTVASPPHRQPRKRSQTALLYKPVVVWTIRIVVFAALITAWEIYGRSVSRALFAPPSEIVESFVELYVTDNEMLPALWTSFGSLILGFAIAIIGGIALGLAMGRVRVVEWVLSPYITFLFSVPYISLIPLLVIWFGVEWKLRVVLVVLASLLPVIINTLEGVKNVDSELIDVARSNCANERQIVRTVILPATLPFIFTGIHVGLGLALVGVVVAEMTAAVTGVGGLIITYANFFRTADLFVPILTLMVVSIGLTRLTHWAEHRAMPWKDSNDG